MTREPEKIGPPRADPGWNLSELARKALGFLAAAVLLVGAVAVSIVAFVFVLAGAAVVGAYLWWRTRELRRQMRTQMGTPSAEGNVIEGEIIEKSVRDAEPRNH